ncbi:uncharacterized protein ACNLHF_018817 [Anomaloglossus baeobatrachus]|uniref:uncharacterized protein LOC142310066 n=1 Tax=Anomaloglossus baeobatrachus TaxID=238106 RepID=UPI003F4F64D8
MNLVWTVLLLAAATGSVYSQACVSYSGMAQQFKQAIQSEFQKQCTGLLLPVVNSGLIANLLNPITKITGLVINTANVAQLYFSNDGTKLNTVVNLGCKSSEIAIINIQVTISVPITFDVLNGCPHYIFNVNLVVINLSVTGLNLNIALGQALVTAVLQTVTVTVKSVFVVVEGVVNTASSAVTTVFQLNGVSCSYYHQSVTPSTNYVIYSYSLIGDDFSISNTNYPVTPSQGTEVSVFQMAENTAAKLISLAAANLQTKVALSSSDCTSLGLGGLGVTAGIYLNLNFGELTSCVISSAGVYVTAAVGISIQAGGTVYVQASASLMLSAQVNVNARSIGVIIGENIAASNVQVTTVIPGCGCLTTVLQNLASVITNSAGTLQAALNVHFQVVAPIPAVLGSSGSTGVCTPNAGYCSCLF